MTKLAIPIIFVVIAIALFFTYIDPTYSRIQELQAKNEEFREALRKAHELENRLDDLNQKYNSFSTEDLERLEKLLPDNINNVRLILDIDALASEFGVRAENLSLENEEALRSGVSVEDASPYASAVLSFTINTTYDEYLAFLKELEASLRITDLVNLSFASSQSSVDDYSFKTSIQTYWLK